MENCHFQEVPVSIHYNNLDPKDISIFFHAFPSALPFFGCSLAGAPEYFPVSYSASVLGSRFGSGLAHRTEKGGTALSGTKRVFSLELCYLE